MSTKKFVLDDSILSQTETTKQWQCYQYQHDQAFDSVCEKINFEICCKDHVCCE